MATRFPGVLLRLPAQLVEAYISLGLMGLAAHERFSLKSTCDFFVSSHVCDPALEVNQVSDRRSHCSLVPVSLLPWNPLPTPSSNTLANSFFVL